MNPRTPEIKPQSSTLLRKVVAGGFLHIRIKPGRGALSGSCPLTLFRVQQAVSAVDDMSGCRPLRQLWSALAFAVLAILCESMPSHAAVLGIQLQNTVISFDDMPDGTAINTQYHNSGIDFKGVEFVNNVLKVTTFAGAPSAPNALNISYGPNEFPTGGLRGFFINPHHTFVKIRISGLLSANGVLATLMAFDTGGNLVASANGGTASGTFGTLQVVAGNGDIASFALTVSGYFAVVDDVTFDPIFAPPLPDFTLRAATFPVVMLPGGAAVMPKISIGRLDGSTGPITLALSAPAGVTGSISPNPSNEPDGAIVDVRLVAASNATRRDTYVTVTGVPSASAGEYGSHAVSIPIRILDSYDAQIVGIEVTQGVQNYDLPRGSSGAHPLLGTPVPYKGVRLANREKTVVRVFADFAQYPESSPMPIIGTVLHGVRKDGSSLPGSPLHPIGDNGRLILGVNFVDDLTRSQDSPYGSSLFVLPKDWTSGIITLKAQLNVVPLFGGSPSSDSNPANDSFTLTDIAFTPTRALIGSSIPLVIDEESPRGPSDVFAEALNLLPTTGLVNGIGGIDISDIYHQEFNPPCSFCAAGSINDLTRGALVISRLQDVRDDLQFDYGTFLFGIYPQSAKDRIRGQGGGGDNIAIAQDQGRGKTAVAHELGHLLRRSHASYANGGGAGGDAEDWPDPYGGLNGVGFDRRYFKVFFPNRTGDPQIYDFMSYAAKAESSAWISTIGWEEEIGVFATGPAGTIASALGVFAPSDFSPMSAVAAKSSLRVLAFVDSENRVFITKVAPSDGNPQTPPPTSNYHLQLHDSRGRILSDTLMNEITSRVEHDSPILMLDARVQTTGEPLGDITIVKNGTTVAVRARSKHSPSVRILEVEPDVVLSKDKDYPKDKDYRSVSAATSTTATRIRWIATDADHDFLLTKVDVSIDGGQTWRPLHFGPNQNLIVLPSSMFSSSPNARVRVRVNDGFNETVAVSKTFTAAGAPPVVQIIDPLDGNTIKALGSLFLNGTAVDDVQKRLLGTSLSWHVGSRLLGAGTSISVSDLQKGKNEISLTATDSQGRSSTASVVVNVVP